MFFFAHDKEGKYKMIAISQHENWEVLLCVIYSKAIATLSFMLKYLVVICSV